MSDITKSLIPTTITSKQASDTGMAMVLILLLLGFFLENDLFYKIAIPILLLNMIYPRLYYPFAVVWLGLSNILGTVMSKVLLTFLYVIFVLPVGLFRRLIGKDPMKMKRWKNETSTVMKIRNKKYTGIDLTNPY